MKKYNLAKKPSKLQNMILKWNAFSILKRKDLVEYFWNTM